MKGITQVLMVTYIVALGQYKYLQHFLAPLSQDIVLRMDIEKQQPKIERQNSKIK